MNRLLKNTDGQHIYFRLLTTGNLPNPGAGPDVQVSLNGGAKSAGGRSIADLGEGLYVYPPLQAETDADEVAYYFGGGSGAYPPVVVSFRTEVAGSGGDVTLAAAQPHYAPYKVGDLVNLAANQDVRHVLGNVDGNVLGGLAGAAGSVNLLAPSAINALLDQGAGVQEGLTVRQALRQLVAALVNVHPTFITAVHLGPTQLPIVPRYPQAIRTALYNATGALTKVLTMAEENPDPLVLSQDLRTACVQLAVALDAVRTSTL